MAKVGRGLGRKPVTANQAAQAALCPQDAIWSEVRTLKTFSRGDLCVQLAKKGLSGINDHTVKSYLTRLQRGGFITVVDTQPYKGVANRYIYELVRDAGRHAPRIKADGSPVTQGSGNDNMWRAMKVLGEFSYLELVAASNTGDVTVSPHSAKRYIQHLRTAGYLAVVRQGGPNKAARYRLLPSKNTGPLAPMVQRVHRVYDPNLKRIVWREDQ